jgi:glycosyltransferase involved in cell wall biosynthesis
VVVSQVTAVIPCFNAADWLRQSIESTLAQSRPVAEVLVVDDCSTDGSAAIAAEYPVRLLRTPVNSGPSAARNLGIAFASHELIALLDADDYWDPCHCEVVVPMLASQASAALAFSGVRFGNAGNRPAWQMASDCPGPTSLLWKSLQRTVIPIMSVVARRQHCLDVGGFRENLRAAEDFDLWLRLALKYPFVWTRTVTATYRAHPKQLSRDTIGGIRAIWRSRLSVIRDLRETGEMRVAAEMLARSRIIWSKELAIAWHRGRFGQLQAMLDTPDSHELDTPLSDRLRRFFSRQNDSGVPADSSAPQIE